MSRKSTRDQKLAATAEALTAALDTVKTSPRNRLDSELHIALANLEDRLREFLDSAYVEGTDYEDDEAEVATAGGVS